MRLTLADGAVAQVVDEALELRDEGGRLLFRYRDGEAELLAPSGDLRLAAPAGRIVIDSASDLELRAGRDVIHEAGRTAALRAGDSRLEVDGQRIRATSAGVDVNAKRSQVAVGKATVLARHLVTRAERAVCKVERYELTAERIVERSRDTFREVTDLLQEKTGRLRTFVRGMRSLHSERTVMVSDKETSIDGEKVLLG